MKRVLLYSPVQETATLFLNASLEKFQKENINLIIFSNNALNLGFAKPTTKFEIVECKGNNKNPLSLFADLSLFNNSTKNDLFIFNGSTTILLALLFKIIKPSNSNAFILHGTLKSKGIIINAFFITFLFIASLIGVEIYSVNNRFNRFILRKNKFHFLGIAGVGVREDAIPKLRPRNEQRIKASNHFNIAFIGRNEISKGYDLFIKLASAFNDINIDFISIGSEGDVKPSHDSKIIHYGALSQDLLFQRLNEIDILILPSKSEGLGMVMVECCIAGIPSITSKTDGSLQFIKNKETGIIVQKNDINLYINAVKEIISNYQFYSSNCIKYSIDNNYFISKPIAFNW